jgi:hypothetical protein
MGVTPPAGIPSPAKPAIIDASAAAKKAASPKSPARKTLGEKDETR